MTHHETIKSLIKPYIGEETKVFPKFLHWILSDPKYGSINHTNEPKSIKAIQGVIDLYKEWIDTGIKPSKEIWLKAKDVAAAAYAAYAAYADAHASAAYADAHASAAAASIPRSEVAKAQIDKLNELIRENNGMVSNDEETPNTEIGDALISSLKELGYSIIKTDKLEKMQDSIKKMKNCLEEVV